MKKIAFVAVGALVGCLAVLPMSLLKHNDFDILIYVLIWLAGFAAIGVLLVLFRSFLAERIATRKAALRALGKGGIKAVCRDKSAREAYKGIFCLMRGKFPQAEEYLTKALNLSDMRNNQLFCLQWLGRLYEAVDNESKLFWCHKKSVEYAPDNPEYQATLGHDYLIRGQLEKSEYCFNQAVKYDPNHGYSRYSLARIFIIRGEDERAVRALIDLLEIQQNHPLIYSELAIIYAMHSDEEKCRDYYNKAIVSGLEKPQGLSDTITAIYAFNHSENYSGEDLPHYYYRYKPEEADKKTSCGHECKYCMLNKKENSEENAGDE